MLSGLRTRCAAAALLAAAFVPLPAGLPAAVAAGFGVERASSTQGLDRTIRKISLSHHVMRIRGLAAICVQSKRVLSMNVRYADLDGDCDTN